MNVYAYLYHTITLALMRKFLTKDVIALSFLFFLCEMLHYSAETPVVTSSLDKHWV